MKWCLPCRLQYVRLCSLILFLRKKFFILPRETQHSPNSPHKSFFIMTIFMTILLTINTTPVYSRNYVIYAIHQDVPMGTKDEQIHKNFFLNLGKIQGIQEGTILKVYRTLSLLDPYQQNKKLDHNIFLGFLKVIHVEHESSIGIRYVNHKQKVTEQISLDVKDYMIGDTIDIDLEEHDQ